MNNHQKSNVEQQLYENQKEFDNNNALLRNKESPNKNLSYKYFPQNDYSESKLQSPTTEIKQTQLENQLNLSYLKNNVNEQLKQTYTEDNKQNKTPKKKTDIEPIKYERKGYIRQIKQDENRRLKVFKHLKDLYNNTSGLRNVEEQYKNYVREIEDKAALDKNYSLNLKNKKIVGEVCNAYIQVRGDGNCFYTAFGFQFLYHLLFSYSDQEFTEFIYRIQNLKMRFRISYIKQQIDDQSIEKDLFEEFIYILEELRQIETENRFMKLKEEFAKWQINQNGDGFLYCLQTLFFRNLSYHFLEQSDLKDVVLDKENLLIWEEECNTNEVIIKLLAEQLKIHIKLLFLENEVILREYEQHNKNIIILLIKPGHYNIGWNLKQQ
ncbi:unnamed protein product [Paramecium primaurelia]|uniref:OTU domain-containing protein n=1 Tax=Paramecium primaurelia TaxID=5886 RepID=A0A8S1L638_PARPR|nr:unnamed protein product [Paramecium primaurelia]